MPRLAAGKQRSRSGSLPARKRRPRLSPVGYLANPASLTGIPKLNSHHSGTRLTFGDAKLTSLAQTLVEIDLANESDWIAAAKVPSALVDRVIRRFLHEHGQELIAEHFELCLSLAESIVDTTYTESEPAPNGQLLLVLNTESSFPLGVGKAIDELERHQPGLGAAFYNCLRQALYRWVRVYDDWDARNRIEQMTEWAEGEDDPESYEIPKLEQDLPECLKVQTATDSLPSLASFPTLDEPWLRELVQTTIELTGSRTPSNGLNSTKNGWNGSAATTLSTHHCLPSCCTSVPETPSWPASMTNANTGARKHRSPTSSFLCNPKIRRACVRHSPYCRR